LQKRLYRQRACWLNGSGQKFIARGYHTTGADLCTKGSKKHEMNLSKARSAGAISMSLFVPLLELNRTGLNPIDNLLLQFVASS
jgi:hypothetical protein